MRKSASNSEGRRGGGRAARGAPARDGDLGGADGDPSGLAGGSPVGAGVGGVLGGLLLLGCLIWLFGCAGLAVVSAALGRLRSALSSAANRPADEKTPLKPDEAPALPSSKSSGLRMSIKETSAQV